MVIRNAGWESPHEAGIVKRWFVDHEHAVLDVNQR